MNIIKEVMIVRRSIIVMLVVSSVWFPFNFLNMFENSLEISAKSGFGEITLFDPVEISLFNENEMYQNNDLSFQISKPDNTWEIHSASDDFGTFEMSSLKSKGYLGGIYLEKEHDKKFLITVFDIQKETFQLNEYIENQISLVNSKENSKIIINQVSKSNDWAIFSVYMGTSDEKRYGEQLLFLKDNRLYMLQYSGNSPQTLDSEQKNDFKFIMESFEVI